MNKILGFILGFFLLLGCGFTQKPEGIVQEKITKTKTEAEDFGVVWHWENTFSKAEVIKIKTWLTTVNQAVTKTLGKYPFPLHLYIHRAESANEPVPWAHTSRGKEQSVHFHVCTDYELDELLKDWTAAHEISHLSIPFVGKKNMWFSEGYASFMQNQIMRTQGIYTEEEMERKYSAKFQKCNSAYQTNLVFPAAADSLKVGWNYPDVYWGGASFFYTLNEQLQTQHNISLMEVIQKYEGCCRVNEDTPGNFVEVLDSISGGDIASQLLKKYSTEPAYKQFEKFK